MIEIFEKYSGEPDVDAYSHVALPFETRQKSRFRAALASGEPMAVTLPRGQVLRGGDLLKASDGRIVRVDAAPEPVLHVTCADTVDFARAAYHLGNRHVPVEVGAGYLRLPQDHVLERMLVGLGAQVSKAQLPFEPEAGAYGGSHRHGDGDHGRPARIHEYVLSPSQIREP